jgi:sugar/nucleoside kinase (ribokinase family)
VSTEYLRQTTTDSSFSIGLNFAGERTLFVAHVERRHEFTYDGLHTPWLYVSSLGAQWHEAYAHVLDFAVHSGARLAFNPGTPQLQEGTAGILPMLRQTEYLFVSRSEAERILDTSLANVPVVEALQRLQALGPRNVVVTSGRAGADALDAARRYYHQGVLRVPVVEATGAGDSFATGCLAAIMLGLDMPTALLWGTVNAASVIGQIGSQPGLLDRDTITARAAGERTPDLVAGVV